MSAASSEARSAEVPGVRITDVRYEPRFRTPQHEHEHDCVTVALGGALSKKLRGWERVLAPGAVAITPAETPHVDRFGAHGGRVLVVEGLGGPDAPRIPRTTPDSLRVGWLGYRLASELRAADDAAPVALHGAALELLAVLSRAQRETSRQAPRWLVDVTEFLHEHKLERIALEELASLAGVHRTHLARTFPAFHGLSVGAYLRRLRIEWAAEALLARDASIADVAARAGFADQSHFTRTFVNHFGLPPGRWRSARA